LPGPVAIERCSPLGRVTRTVVAALRPRWRFKTSAHRPVVLIGMGCVALFTSCGVYASWCPPNYDRSTAPDECRSRHCPDFLPREWTFSTSSESSDLSELVNIQQNAALILDFALPCGAQSRERIGDAIFEACLLRFRPHNDAQDGRYLRRSDAALGTGNGLTLRRRGGIACVGGWS